MQYPSSLLNIEDEYSESLSFIQEHPAIEYGELDGYVLGDLRLFDVPKDMTIAAINDTLDRIIHTLPAMKRIFAKPIVHLKDVYELAPIETVHKINNYTLAHAAIHSELWDDVGPDGVKPKKLMTLEKAENYVIYENVVFTRAVDSILRFVKSTLLLLNDIMYSRRDLHFNLLDRTHHSLYFLAIGKLHVEYATAQTEQGELYARCIDKLLYIDRTLRSKLSSPVCKKCRSNRQKITLERTNTFRSHKDYKQLYVLLKSMDLRLDKVEATIAGGGVERDGYRAFCLLLSLFAAQHFGFTMSPSAKISFETFKASMQLGGWMLTLREVRDRKVNGLDISLKKDKEYTVCILFNGRSEITDKDLEAFKRSAGADEYLFACPHTYGGEDVLYLSLYDVDSFRRIQQIMLRGMIYSDETHDVCPFCGGRLWESSHGFECKTCRGIIQRRTCPDRGEEYYISCIKKVAAGIESSRAYNERNRYLHDRINEARLHFRNITPISSDGEPICPKCGKTHSK